MAKTPKRFRARAKPVPHHTHPMKKCNKRKQWSNEAMEAALAAVKNGTGVNKAAQLHGIPCTTLKDRVAGRVVHVQGLDLSPI